MSVWSQLSRLFPEYEDNLDLQALRGCFPNMRTTLILQAFPGCFPNYKDDAHTILIPEPFKRQGRAFRVAVKTGRSPPARWHYGRLSECSATGSLAQVVSPRFFRYLAT